MSENARETETLHRLLAGSILIQAALCGLTICLVMGGVRFSGLQAAVVMTALLIAFAAVAFLAQEIPVRALRRLQLRRRVDKRLLARIAGPRRDAAQAALLQELEQASVHAGNSLRAQQSLDQRASEDRWADPRPVPLPKPTGADSESCSVLTPWDDPTLQVASVRVSEALAEARSLRAS